MNISKKESRDAAHLESLIGNIADDFAERVSKGEQPNIEDYACEHPQVASALRRVLPTVEVMCALGDNDSTEDPSEKPFRGVLGDYIIVREIGRGGMGVVYEAEQISLQRRVALKVLPFASVMDQRQLQRFKLEAQAAAGLKHPHIVHIYQIGCERAVHFYAMEFIDGYDLAELIGQLRQQWNQDSDNVSLPWDADHEQVHSFVPGDFAQLEENYQATLSGRGDSRQTEQPTRIGKATDETEPLAMLATQGATSKPEHYRTIATMGIQAAEALEFAHQRGILHRDIKPSNLMVDSTGKLWITDFGLARVEADASLTMTGDIMGTLRYMSPEQAVGQNATLDQRTDVYSLGVTLYELLTLHPAFPHTDRIELLRSRMEYVPIPLRRINESIPADLETIVLKAMATKPVDRYATAQDLADDLQRFSNNEPIVARRPSLADRVLKWSQRNKALALWFATALVGGVVAATAVVMVDKEREVKGSRQPAVTKSHMPEISVTPGDSRPSSVSLPVYPSDVQSLPGLIPFPEKIPGISRWQIFPRNPQAFTDNTSSISWSPDGQRMAVGGSKQVLVFAMPSFELTNVFIGHTKPITVVAWSPDGKQIASASLDKSVCLWNAETGIRTQKLLGHLDRIDCIAWHPNSNQFATGSRDRTVRLWRRTGETGPTLHGHTNNITAIFWSPDGSQLVTGSKDGTSRRWRISAEQNLDINDPRNGEVILRRRGGINSIRCSPEGGRLLVTHLSGTDIVRLVHGTKLNEESGLSNGSQTRFEVIRVFDKGPSFDADWSPDGNYVVAVSAGCIVQVFDAAGRPGPILGRYSEVAVRWSPQGKQIATMGAGRSIRLWNPSQNHGVPLKTSSYVNSAYWSPGGGAPYVNSMSWHPDGESFACSLTDGTVQLRDSTGLNLRKLPAHQGKATWVAWSPDGKRLLSCGEDGSARLWNAKGTMLSEFKRHRGTVWEGSWNPNNQLLATYASEVGRPIRLWSPDGTVRGVIRGHGFGKTIHGMAWNPRGDRLASVGADESLRLWDIKGQAMDLFHVGDVTTAMAWNPNGTQIACGCNNGSIQLWNLDGSKSRILEGHTDKIWSLAWSPDGTFLASGGFDTSLRLWETDSKRQVILRGHDAEVEQIAWHPTSRKFLSCGDDSTIRLWNADTQEMEWMLVVLANNQSLKFKPNGRILDGDPAVLEREFYYIVEQPNGAIEVLKPSEFQNYVKQISE